MTDATSALPDWISLPDRSGGPIYGQIVTALEDAVARGVLRPGDRLPTQRALADRLGVDLTTVTRAYTEARHRGLLDAVTGRGSFIAGGSGSSAPAMDLSMLMPPPPQGLVLGELIERGIAGLLARTNADVLMAYHVGPGAPPDRIAGAHWLEPTLGPIPPERIVICPGAQPALAGIVSLLARAGDILLTEPETYPGLINLAAHLKLNLVPVARDEDGLLPDALAAACRAHSPRALYIQPTIQNPTTATMPEARRRDIARVVAVHNLMVIEDDPYSRLIDHPSPALAHFAPERTFHVATLAKTMTPGLRTAYVAVPEGFAPETLADAMRALTLMPAPLMTALATRWIMEGTATHLLSAVRREARARQALARELLPAGAVAHPDGLHVWQTLPDHWDRQRLTETARRQGLGVMPAEAFSVGFPAPNAVRISLGAVTERARLATALAALAAIISGKSD